MYLQIVKTYLCKTKARGEQDPALSKTDPQKKNIIDLVELFVLEIKIY